MNIFDYIEKYSNYDFNEKEFNEVDNIIFSCLSYINYSGILNNSIHYKLSIHQIGNEIKNKYGKTNRNTILAIKLGLMILESIMDTKRYRDVLVYNYKYYSDQQTQFGAVSFDISKDLMYVCYEGTDFLMSGWLEDCMISYTFPVKAQKLAIKYLNKYLFTRKKIIVGGHSKGGHLSIIASMYSNYFIKNRIIKIYSNDGLGLTKKQLESSKYKSIENLVIKLIPNYSIVGHLLYSSSNYSIIKSSVKSLRCHNPLYWVINEDKFIRSDNSKFCIILKKSIYRFLEQYDLDSKIKFVETFFDVCKKNNIETLYDFKKNKKFMFKILLTSEYEDIEIRGMFKKLYSIIKECYKEEREVEEI